MSERAICAHGKQTVNPLYKEEFVISHNKKLRGRAVLGLVNSVI
jgi:hypothetical protein